MDRPSCRKDKRTVDTDKKSMMRKPGLHRLVSLQLVMSGMHAWTTQRTLDVVDELYQIGAITYPRTESTGIDAHAMDQADEAIAFLKSAGHDVHPQSDVRILLTMEPEQPGITFYDIPGIMPIAEIPAHNGPPSDDDRKKAYDEIVAQFIHAVAPAA